MRSLFLIFLFIAQLLPSFSYVSPGISIGKNNQEKPAIIDKLGIIRDLSSINTSNSPNPTYSFLFLMALIVFPSKVIH